MKTRTIVIFRIDDLTGEALAFFPELPASRRADDVTCYARVGQHHTATKLYYGHTRPIRTPAERAAVTALYAELERAGYDDLADRVVWHWQYDDARRRSLAALPRGGVPAPGDASKIYC